MNVLVWYLAKQAGVCDGLGADGEAGRRGARFQGPRRSAELNGPAERRGAPPAPCWAAHARGPASSAAHRAQQPTLVASCDPDVPGAG